MATAKTAPKPAPKPAFAFQKVEAPAAKAGPGRKMNAEMAAFVDEIKNLPVSDPDTADGWYAWDAPDVSTFVGLLRTASNRLNVSTQVRHNVAITKDDTLNPGTVTFRIIPRRHRNRNGSAKK